MQIALWVMAGLALSLLAFAFSQSPSLAWAGLRSGGNQLIQILPLLLAAFAVAGLAQVLIPRELVLKWLGPESGWRGIFIGTFVGAATPGGPYTAFPIVAGLYKAGAGIGPVVAYITGWVLWSFFRLPLEVAMVGPYVTAVRLLSTLAFPPLAGFLAQGIVRLVRPF